MFRKNKLSTTIAAAFAFCGTASALEITQEGNNIVFDSIESGNYKLRVLDSNKEIHTFDVKGEHFVLSADMLGVKFFADGQYKYELSPYTPSNILANSVRDLDDKDISDEYASSFKATQKPESGTFTLSDNNLAPQIEESHLKDQVFNDDLIVNGSACIGLDCANGESFGFDTIRLKENNLRIKAQDTSNTASFPGNDWQITFNDSSNGGQNKFSIDDIDGGRTPFTIEAGAPSHSLYVDDGGRIGLGTSTPAVELHIANGDSPTLRLEQNGSSGFTAQTWDVAGNETNFFVRDTTNGSKLPFRIEPSTPSDTLYLDSTGNIGFGTTSPDDNLDIEANGPSVRLTHTGANSSTWRLFVKDDSGRFNITDDPSLARIPFKFINGANNNLMKVGVPSDTVEINGKLKVNGDITATGTITPDYVFQPGYELKTIEEHAKFMWKNSHLPMVEKAKVNENGQGIFSLNERSQQLLEELEIAHIYIDQLNTTVKKLEKRLTDLEKK